MTDVQVSNARRIGFTALALVSFWILSLREYLIASEDAYGQLRFFPISSTTFGIPEGGYPPSPKWFLLLGEPDWDGAYLVASMALVPFVFLLMSESNSPSKLLAPRNVVFGALSVATLLLARWLGLDYTWVDGRYGLVEFGESMILVTETRSPDLLLELREEHDALRWPWILLPLAITSAFVIFGAWRRAVKAREAGAEAADEDARMSDPNELGSTFLDRTV